MHRFIRLAVWAAVALAGAGAYATLALRRGEPVNSAYLLTAALCSYALGYRFYSKWIAARLLVLEDGRATPCEVREDGKDFVRTNPWIVFGHHFAAISGPGPLVGPVLAAQFGYLPSTLWILVGCVLGGAVQDFVILFCSVRRGGKSLAQMVREELGTPLGVIGVIAILSIMVILLAVLALVVVKALADSPWGVFTVGATIPIAMFMGGYLRFIRVGKVLEVSVLGVGLLLLAVWGGQAVHGHAEWASRFSVPDRALAWGIIAYGFAASVLPVWLLLAPRDYLSTFMKLGTIFALAFGVFVVLPDLKMPALSRFIDGSGPVVPGKLFPFCFITIACGAISGFHSLIASGVTPKIITRERYVRSVGYGAMCLESLVAMMALIAACTLDPGIYLGMNVADSNPDLAARAASIVQKVEAAGVPLSAVEMQDLAKSVKEQTLFGRTGGAATLAVGMAKIFSTLTHGRWLDLWYHFAIMFEALFILTTLDAGTRVGRYLLQDLLGGIWRPLGDVQRVGPNVLASGLMVCGWGFFLVQGVRDPEGGVKALWPLFGIANQMLAAIALCLGTTVILKQQLSPRRGARQPGRPVLALATFLPLVWLLAVTLTAGVQKIAHPDPRVGFLAQARVCSERLAAAEAQLRKELPAAEREATERRCRAQRQLWRNQWIDAVAAGGYLVLLTAFVALSLREWWRLLAGRVAVVLHEAAAVMLPEGLEASRRRWPWWTWFSLALLVARELSGQAAFERQRLQGATGCSCQAAATDPRRVVVRLGGGTPAPAVGEGQAWQDHLERRYRTPRSCC